MSSRTLVILNPVSARSRRALPKIQAALKENCVDFDLQETASAGDATSRTRTALRDGYQLIAVVGGDGTLSEVASGFFEFKNGDPPSPINNRAALAVLPAGTGDDFARGITGGREPIERWLEKLVRFCRRDSGTGRLIDVILGRTSKEAQDFICLNVATIGLGAEVAARVAAQGIILKGLPGEMRFVSAAISALAAWRERRVRVTFAEGQSIRISTNLIAVANGRYAGGGMMFAPDAQVDDGLIDVVLTHDLPRSGILREFPRIRRGEHVANPKVDIVQTTQVKIETDGESDALLVEADGNVRGHTPAEFRIIPKAIHLVD